MANSPTLGEIAKLAARAESGRLRVCLPARVERYDASAQLVDVKPLLMESQENEDGTTSAVSMPIIPNVPLAAPGAGGFRITFPVAVGDTVLLVFSDRSIDRWMYQGGEVDPLETRRHDLNDAIAIPGLHDTLHAWTGASTNSLTMGADGGAQIEITSSEIRLGGSSSPVALDSSVQSALTTLKTAIGSAPVTPGDGGAAFKASLVAALATWPPSVGASKVKAT